VKYKGISKTENVEISFDVRKSCIHVRLQDGRVEGGLLSGTVSVKVKEPGRAKCQDAEPKITHS